MSNKKISVEDILKIIVFLLIYRSLATNAQGIFKVTYWDKYIYGIICCMVLTISLVMKGNFKLYIRKEEVKLVIWMFTPIVISWLYSMLITKYVNIVPYDGYGSRAFSNVMFPLLALVLGLLVFKTFGQKSIKLIFYTYVSCYLTSVVVALCQGGLSQFELMLTDSFYNSSVLEMSEVSPALCIFMVYFLYEYRYRNLPMSKLLFRELICLFILIIGMKRILIISSMILLAFYFAMRKRVDTIKNWVIPVSCITIFVCLLFVWSISNGMLYAIIDAFEVNSMARNHFWSGIENTYTFSPFFLGRGIGFAGKWMDSNWRSLNILGMRQSTGLHSDILKYYIELGFMGFIIYLYTYLGILTNKIRKLLDNQSAFVYFMLMLFQILCWFTDNISTYHIVLWPLYMVMFCLISDSRQVNI